MIGTLITSYRTKTGKLRHVFAVGGTREELKRYKKAQKSYYVSTIIPAKDITGCNVHIGTPLFLTDKHIKANHYHVGLEFVKDERVQMQSEADIVEKLWKA